MSPEQSALARKNLTKRLASLHSEAIAVPPRGWLAAIRDALGLTTRQLAARMGAAPSRVTAIEKAELTGATTIKTLREAAEAMDCIFVYAIMPRTSLDDIVRSQAARRADEEFGRLHHTMQLENQALTTPDLAAAREGLVNELLSGPARRLWDQA